MIKRCLLLTFILLTFSISAQQELWGTTRQGGSIFAGTIFKLDADGNNYALRYDWTDVINGKRPLCAVTEFSNGKLYGVTIINGAYGYGVLFEYDYTVDNFIKLHDFDYPTGSLPEGKVIEGSNGLLYGLAGSGGAFGNGTLYQYDLGTDTYTVLKDFELATDGASPHGHMTEALNGKLYGINSHGGANGYGTIFEWDPVGGVFTKKIDLDSINNGFHPYGGFHLEPSGLMYAMSYNGGVTNQGVLFEYDPVSNTTTKRADFTGLNGSRPYGNLIRASNGKLYGLTFEGGVNNQGTLFEYDINTTTLTKLVDLSAATTGSYPKGDLVESYNGKLYGYTSLGGDFNKGTVFEYDIANDTLIVKMHFAGLNGQYNTNSFIKMCAKPIIDIVVSPNDTVCSNELLTLTAFGTNPTYNWNNGITNGVAFNPSAGTDYYVVTATNACGTSTDSVQIVTYQGYNLTEEDTICSGSSYTFPDGTTMSSITSTVIHNNNFTTVLGCDSVITTTVYVDPVYNLAEFDTVCSGDSYTFPDGFVLNNITTNTNYSSLLTSSKGCDSTINTAIYVNPEYNIVQNVEVCSGDSYTYPDGFIQNNITSSTSYLSSFMTTKGCDSLITTNVTVNPVYNLTDSVAVCSGDSYIFHDGFTETNITSTVTHISALSSSEGCDSTITTTVSVNPTYDVSETVGVCPGSSYTFPDGATVTNIQNNITHVSNLVGSMSCDTTVTTELIVHTVYDIQRTDTVCRNAAFTFDDGTVVNNITDTTTHISTYSSVNNCDSIITETVYVNSIDTSVVAGEYSIISNQDNANYQWVDCNNNYAAIPGQTSQTFIPDTNGLYAVIITKDACSDTSACSVIDALDIAENRSLQNMRIYPNPTSAEVNLIFAAELENVNIEVLSLRGELLYSTHFYSTNQTTIDIDFLPAGVYMIRVQSGTDVATERITKY